jgi:predicted  nucleic acid-binding Zn-ribbon protein
MKIKRFNESIDDEVNISPDRVGEIIEELRDVLSSLEEKNKIIESYVSELSNYRTNSKKGNDQIDDSIAAFQVVKKNIDESIEKTDTVINNLVSYIDEGRKFLYTENK